MTIQMLKDKVKSLGLYMLWRIEYGEILIYNINFNEITFNRCYSDTTRLSDIWKDIEDAYSTHGENSPK